MKAIVLMMSLLLTTIATANTNHNLVIEEYLYTGNYLAMSKSLEKKLLAKINSICGTSQNIEISEFSVNFKLGYASSGEALPAEISQVGSESRLTFPHHPRAILSASFSCN